MLTLQEEMGGGTPKNPGPLEKPVLDVMADIVRRRPLERWGETLIKRKRV